MMTVGARDRFLDRRAAVAALLADRKNLLVVTGAGAPAYDVAAVGDHHCNFYLWGALGCASMVGLGLALARPEQRVAVITGDGDMLMGLGSLATIGALQPRNIAVIVLDNERYGETGMQASSTAFGIDLAGIATACKFKTAITVTDDDGIATLGRLLHSDEGPIFAGVKVNADNPSRVLPPRDGVYLKHRFRHATLGAGGAPA